MRSPVVISVLAAAIAAYLVLWPQAPVSEGDSQQYLDVARDLADGRLDNLHDRTPGYPVLLVLTGSAQVPTRSLFVVSLLLHAASVWMLAAVLNAVGAGRLAVIAAVAVLLLPPYVEPAGHVMTENLAQFTLVAGFASLVSWVLRPRRWLVLAAAVAFAASSLTRPIYQVLTPALGAGLLCAAALTGWRPASRRQALMAAAALVMVSGLLLAGYAGANRLRFGFFGVTHTAGFHLSTRTMAFVERLPDEHAAVREILVRERDAQLTKRGGTHTGTQAIWSVREELSAATGLDMPQLSRFLLAMNLRLIADAPLEYAGEVVRSMAGYWLPAAAPLASMNSRALRWTWAMIHTALFVAFVLQLAVFGGILLFAASRRVARGTREAVLPIRATDPQVVAYVLAGVIIGYNMLLSCTIDIGEPRQRLATEALFVFMSLLGLRIWRQSVAADAAAEQDASPSRR